MRIRIRECKDTGKPEQEMQHCSCARINVFIGELATHLVCLLLDFDYMFPQLFTIRDPRFLFEERLGLRTQSQKTAVRRETSKVCFGFVLPVHDCGSPNLVGVWVGRKTADRQESASSMGWNAEPAALVRGSTVGPAEPNRRLRAVLCLRPQQPRLIEH